MPIQTSFLLSFVLSLVGTALFVVIFKLAAGISIESSIITAWISFFLIFVLIRTTLAGKTLPFKSISFEVITMLFTVLILEIGINLIFSATPSTSIPNYAFSSSELRQEYKDELEQANRAQTFEQYVMYKGVKFNGKYINQDENGIRNTWVPESHDATTISNVYMFGGSTLWGYYARDDHTIPSYLSKHLHSKDIRAKITNHGVLRDSSSTELIRLFQLLKAGHKIDLVVFYDGFNDLAAGARGEPGHIRDYERYKSAVLSKKDGLDYIKQGVEKLVRDYSAMYKLKKMATPRIKTSKRPTTKNSDQLIDDIVHSYLETVRAIDQLSKVYGFKYACFWQPMAYLESSLTPEEQPWVEASNNVQRKFLIGPKVNLRLPTGLVPNFYNISDALKGRNESVYIDIGHLTEKGNEIISRKMGDILISNYLASVQNSSLSGKNDLSTMAIQ